MKKEVGKWPNYLRGDLLFINLQKINYSYQNFQWKAL
jgi:hypothetical protein